MDGLAYTSGSVSAFLTQGYAILIPLWTALIRRRLPDLRVGIACLLVIVGAAVLSGISWTQRQLGRGEWETLAGSVLFAAQILWLERPLFRANRTLHATTLMFATMGLVCWPLAWHLRPATGNLVAAFASTEALVLLALLTVVCTLLTFPLANHWQPKVSATQAGMLYCTEPVFTSLVCLFVPNWISNATGIQYPNESVSTNLLVGGTLILLANLSLQIPRSEKTADTASSVSESAN
jgi:drug/metabolite transporter (DMT)-like permease